ncbi:secreted RxLR effector protein 161-like [Xenia sp. Carnegie-2017]|uniref:secreted RxLR effector protein 161-like n=1 Tax=Xenia sp. Carnegie-2017 TaxID=2897299 RepID=UPI001F0427FD|nr:secreted RxLR effector protein 161-like [Xenia sp. Carnegie-2017]
MLSEGENPVNAKRYQMAIGCLNYATLKSQPGLAVAVGTLLKFMAKPGLEHWRGVKSILRYIQGKLDYGFHFTTDGNDPVLSGYTDADWGGDIVARRSTTGYIYQINGNTVSWCSKRQGCVAKSTTEAEYLFLSTAYQEGVWLRRLLDSISITQIESTIIYKDNQRAIELSRNPKFHSRTKHIDVAYHYMREKVHEKITSVNFFE